MRSHQIPADAFHRPEYARFLAGGARPGDTVVEENGRVAVVRHPKGAEATLLLTALREAVGPRAAEPPSVQNPRRFRSHLRVV